MTENTTMNDRVVAKKCAVSRSLMTKVEAKKLFRLPTGGYESRWEICPVDRALQVAYKEVRCAHCHGAVRLHASHTEGSPAAHAEHLSKSDSTGCKGGYYFDGSHRMSGAPVE